MSDHSDLPETDERLSLEAELQLTEALRAAWQPKEIDAERHELLLSSCLEDPFAAATEAELIESERLRQDLETQGNHPGAVLARALRTAHTPTAASPQELGRAEQAIPRRSNVVYVTFGAVAGLMAAAAAALLVIAPAAPETSSHEPLAESRTTAPLFNEPFAAGATTSRVDRIVAVREKELRENRYVRWGVR